MNLEEFERVAATFAAFHQEFAPLFGRTEARERSEQYLRGLLVQQTDRRNAENLAEVIVGATPRALQRFLTEATWDDGPVIDRLQRYVGQRLNQPDGVFVLDDTGFAKQGKQSVGVTRQYSGTWARWATARSVCFWPMSRRRGMPWWTRRCICQRRGPLIARVVGPWACPKRSAIRARPNWGWRCCAGRSKRGI